MSEWRMLVRVVVNSGIHSPWIGSSHTAVTISHCAWKEPCAQGNQKSENCLETCETCELWDHPRCSTSSDWGVGSVFWICVSSKFNFGTEDPSIILWKMVLKESEWMTEQIMAASERDQKMSPQIHCFGILTILSWRELRNSRCWKGSRPFPFLSKSKAYISYEIGVLPTPFLSLKTGSWCWDESVPTDFTRWPLSSINFTHIFTFPQFVTSKKPNSFVQMVYKLSGLASSLRFLLLSYVVQSLSRVQLFATPWTAAHQASLSFTISQNLFKLMSIESVMPYSHLILCSLLLLLPSVFPSIRVFSNELALRIR